MSKPLLMLLLFLSCTANAQVKFAMFGDYGCDEPGELAVSQLVKSWNPDFIVTVGDNNYYTGTNADTIDHNIGKYYHDYIKPYMGNYGNGSPGQNRFFPALGNHDFYDFLWFGPNDIRYAGKTYYSYFKLNDTCIHKGNTPDPWSPLGVRYYKFRKGNVEFFIANSGSSPDNHAAFLYSEIDGVDSNSVQAQWFKTQIMNSTAKWKIVVIHHPPYSSAAPENVDDYDVLRWNFKQWGATTVVSGHNHLYESLVIDGFPYFIAGLGGEDKNPFLYPSYTGSRLQYFDKFGSLQCIAYEDSLIFRFITTDEEVIDYYKWVTAQNDAGPSSVTSQNGGVVYTGASVCFDVEVKNFGANSLFFVPVNYSVNGIPTNDPMIISSLDASDSTVVSFCDTRAFVPEAPGEYLLKFFTGATMDSTNENDTLSVLITVTDSSRDAGVIDVSGLSDTILTSVNMNLNVTAKNFGLNTLPFIPVEFLINDTLQITSVITDSVTSGSVSTLQFSAINSTIPLDPGDYSLRVFTDVSGDTNSSNDTLSFTFTVRDSIHDAGVVGITPLPPSDTIHAGTSISFLANVKNFGLDNLSNLAVCYTVNDSLIQRNLMIDSLGTGDTINIIFEDTNSFTPLEAGQYIIKLFTKAEHDFNPANDTMYYFLEVTDSLNLTLVVSLIPQGMFNSQTNGLNIKDSVTVMLRSSVPPYEVVSSVKSFLDSADHRSVLRFHLIQNGSYYLTVVHRNSLEIWSSITTIVTDDPRAFIAFDFTEDSLNAFGGNQIRVSDNPLKFALYSGDVNQDKAIDLSDIIIVYNDANEFETGYSLTDLNGDLFVDLSDITIAFENANKFVTTLSP